MVEGANYEASEEGSLSQSANSIFDSDLLQAFGNMEVSYAPKKLKDAWAWTGVEMSAARFNGCQRVQIDFERLRASLESTIAEACVGPERVSSIQIPAKDAEAYLEKRFDLKLLSTIES